MKLKLNPMITIGKPSATLAINEYVKQQRKEGKTIVHWGFGQSPFPIPISVQKKLKKYSHRKDYAPVQGYKSTRKAIAAHHSMEYNSEIGAKQIILGPGSKEMIFGLLLAIDRPLILPTPSWVSYEPQARLLLKKVIKIDTSFDHHWKVNPQQLDAVCKEVGQPAIIILNSPSNPSGAVYSAEEILAIKTIAERYDLIIISDEIYQKLGFVGRSTSFIEHMPDNTILTNGISKWCGAGGWRFGYAILPKKQKKLMKAMKNIASETFSAVSSPIQLAAAHAFKNTPELEEYISKSIAILKKIESELRTGLTNRNIKVQASQGGFYFMPDFSHYKTQFEKHGITNDVEMCTHMLENAGVAMLPGSSFGMKNDQFLARLAYVDFDGKMALENEDPTIFLNQIEEGLKRLDAWITGLSGE